MLITYEKLQKPIYGGDTGGGVIIITVISGDSNNNDKVTAEIISKSK